MRPTLTVVVALVNMVAACGGAQVEPRGARSTSERLGVVAHELFEALTSGDPERVRALQAQDRALEGMFEPGYVEVVLAQRSADSHGHERIANEWGTFRETRFSGFCARRVGHGVANLPGLRREQQAVGELVLAGRDAAGEWAGVVRDLVQTSAGYRLVRWTVDSPRRDHFELEQWSCEFGTAR